MPPMDGPLSMFSQLILITPRGLERTKGIGYEAVFLNRCHNSLGEVGGEREIQKISHKCINFMKNR